MSFPIRIVLVEPQHPGNIGAVARAMKTMGFKDLYLVAPKQFPHPTANALAARADDILSAAHIVPDVESAIADCGLILATSGEWHTLGWDVLAPREAAERAVAEQQTHPVALLFGCERVGLPKSQLHNAHYHVRIPTTDEYNSLNLAASVQILCYELRLAQNWPYFREEMQRFQEEEGVASYIGLQHFFKRLENILAKREFFYPGQAPQTMARFMRIFYRARLSHRELNMLQGLLTLLDDFES
jgi:tRNA (cytidine32/uridine32-2'-O)-methyltransferase